MLSKKFILFFTCAYVLFLQSIAYAYEDDDDWWVDPPLIKATLNNDIAEVRRIVEEIRKFNQKSEEEQEIFKDKDYSTYFNNYYIVTPAQESETVLYIACSKGNLEIVQLLLENGADINRQEVSSITPFVSACFYGHAHVVQYLIDYDKSVLSPEYGYSFGNALMAACDGANLETVKILLGYNFDINLINNYGYTPLSLACSENNFELAKLLIEHGAIVNTKYDPNPLLLTCSKGHLDMVKFLVEEHNADIHGLNNAALFYAANAGQLEVVKYLISKKAKVNEVYNEEGYTPLMAATSFGRADVVAYLLSQKANVKAKTKEGKTALYFANYHKYTDIIELLKQAGAKK